MTEDEFRNAIALGREQRAVEFKSAGSSKDKLLFAKVARAVLAMANRRDGGYVIIGIGENGSNLDLQGINHADLASWKYDDVADRLAIYADPSIEFGMKILEMDGRKYIVIHVQEFAETPVICKRDYNYNGQAILQAGVIYVRPRRKPESVPVGTYPDMQDLINLAVDKGVREFVRRAGAAGLATKGSAGPQTSDKDRFQAQEDDFL